MKYFFCISVIVLALLFLRVRMYLQYRAIRKMLDNQYALCRQASCLSVFETDFFDLIALAVCRAPYTVRRKLLKRFAIGDIKALFLYLKQNEPPLYFALNVLLKQKECFKKHTGSYSNLSKLALCLIYECQGEYENLARIFSTLPRFFLNIRLRHLQCMLYARCLFLKTDLKKATGILKRLVKFLAKSDKADKVAYAYFMLGDNYRVAGSYDAAHVMYDKAWYIFCKTDERIGQGLVLVALGLNYMSQKKIDEATEYLRAASAIVNKTGNIFYKARILNMQSLCLYLQNLPKQASYSAQKAFEMNKGINHIGGMAFSAELKAVSSYRQGDLKKAEMFAREAVKYFKQTRQEFFENEALYVLACICSAGEQYRKANQIFERLQNRKKMHKAFFNIANIEELRYSADVKK